MRRVCLQKSKLMSKTLVQCTELHTVCTFRDQRQTQELLDAGLARDVGAQHCLERRDVASFRTHTTLQSGARQASCPCRHCRPCHHCRSCCPARPGADVLVRPCSSLYGDGFSAHLSCFLPKIWQKCKQLEMMRIRWIQTCRY